MGRPMGRSAATCHPDKPVRGHTLCDACYQRDRYWSDPERWRATAAANAKRRRARQKLMIAMGKKDSDPAIIKSLMKEVYGSE